MTDKLSECLKLRSTIKMYSVCAIYRGSTMTTTNHDNQRHNSVKFIKQCREFGNFLKVCCYFFTFLLLLFFHVFTAVIFSRFYCSYFFTFLLLSLSWYTLWPSIYSNTEMHKHKIHPTTTLTRTRGVMEAAKIRFCQIWILQIESNPFRIRICCKMKVSRSTHLS